MEVSGRLFMILYISILYFCYDLEINASFNLRCFVHFRREGAGKTFKKANLMEIVWCNIGENVSEMKGRMEEMGVFR